MDVCCKKIDADIWTLQTFFSLLAMNLWLVSGQAEAYVLRAGWHDYFQQPSSTVVKTETSISANHGSELYKLK